LVHGKIRERNEDVLIGLLFIGQLFIGQLFIQNNTTYDKAEQ
jgi:hypothetical protein